MSTTGLTWSDYMNEVAAFMGYGYESDPSSPSTWAGQTLRNITDTVKRSYNKYCYPPGYVWSWMRGLGSLQTVSGKASYEMAEDFGGLRTPMFYPSSVAVTAVMEVSIGMLLKARSRDTSSGYPSRVAFTTQDIKGLEAPKKVAELWRPPSGSWQLAFEYNRRPGPFDSTNDHPMGGPETAELLRLMCLAHAELQLKRIANGPQQLAATQELQAQIANDRLNGPKYLGNWRSGTVVTEATLADIIAQSDTFTVDVQL